MTDGEIILGHVVRSRGRTVAKYQGNGSGAKASRRVDAIDNAHGSYIASRQPIWGLPGDDFAAAIAKAGY